MNDNYFPVFELTRGETIECVHYGAVAISDKDGNLMAWYGNPQTVTFLRSSAKPFQALPFVESGGAEGLAFTGAELALICASHSGTDAHAAVAAGIQKKAGVQETDLQCGVHPPMHKPTADALQARHEAPTSNRHNCSGKHSGMLAFATWKGWSIGDYLEREHPLQRLILKTFSEMAGLKPDQIFLGTDGCSAPNFAMQLQNAARAYANLIDPSNLSETRAQACIKITAAMTAYPEMVGGPDRFDTILMQVAKGKLVAKGGAEGYQGIGLAPGALDKNPFGEGPSPALGIALKISDGDARGKTSAAVSLEVLRQLGALSKSELAELAQFGPEFKVQNWRSLIVGAGRPNFELRRHFA